MTTSRYQAEHSDDRPEAARESKETTGWNQMVHHVAEDGLGHILK
jgi:hypothetical protein